MIVDVKLLKSLIPREKYILMTFSDGSYDKIDICLQDFFITIISTV